ncbi:MAG: penicillin acylase family protein [Woeseiaceae bacterium]|nr:penicillin acylase family protein [Woeseiaceae bacterium]
MLRLLIRSLAGVAALSVVLAVVAWLWVRASLPILEGDIAVAGLAAPVTIERDAAGIPVITAGSREDLAFATGFVHGQDRFFQMDLIRRRGAGELSELFGPAAVEADKRYRLHRFRTLAREVLVRADAGDRRVIERYADGVNAGLESLAASPFEYLLLRASPREWQPEDSVIVVYAMFMQLNDSRARRDVRRGYAQRILPADVYAWMYPDGTPWDAPLMGEPRGVHPYPAADVYSVRDRTSEPPPANERGLPPLDGSNNWAVSGALTATGRAMVSNDMHLGLAAPNIYYQARLVQTGGALRDVTGVTLPGAPFVIAGSNGHIAWGYTNSYGDWSDAVVLRPGSNPDTYLTPDGERSFAVHEELIPVADGSPVRYTVRETVWGPVDDRIRYPDGEIAIRWIAHDPDAVNLNIMRLETATSVEQALDIANTMGMPPQNFVTGDADGNIGWTIAGRIPVRGDYDATLPVDGSAGTGWSGWRDPADYPRIANPVSGRIWSANARVTDAEALAVIGDGGYDLGARAKQIRDGLFARETFTAADMLAIQRDDRAAFLSRWRDLLLDVLDRDTVAEDPMLAAYRDYVANWIPHATPESVGYRLVRSFRLEVRNRVFNGLMEPVRAAYESDVDLLISNQFEAPLWQLVNERPEHLLPANYESWHALLVAAVRDNLRWFASFGPSLGDRTWGEHNTAAIQHPLSRAIPALSDWLDMPRDELSGDSNLPRAQGPDFGASERFSVSPGDEANGLMHMPTGQSGHPMSAFYRKGHGDWVHGRPSPFLPGEPAFSLTLVPAGGRLGSAEN